MTLPGLSIDRAGIALVGAGLMVASGALLVLPFVASPLRAQRGRVVLRL